MERELIQVSKKNEHGYIGYMFSDSKRWASAKVKQDKNGKEYIVSKGKKYFL